MRTFCIYYYKLNSISIQLINILSRFQENFLEIWKNANTKRIDQIFRKVLHTSFKYQSIRSIVVGSILSNPPRYRYYRIGIDTFAIITTITNQNTACIIYRNYKCAQKRTLANGRISCVCTKKNWSSHTKLIVPWA